jgi:uncharacterized membrane protein
MSLQNIKKINIAKPVVFICFAFIYSVISLVNHYLFRTSAHDFGIYNQALYDYAHFRINNNSVIQPGFGNILGDHFELMIMFFAPLYYLFGSYTLLIVQIAAILIGGQGIYKYVELISSNRKFALAAMIQFFLFFGIYSALAFDYHNNVIGTMAVPWIFYFFHKNKWKQTVFCFIIFLLSKENMALWGFFIFAGLMIRYRKDRKKLLWSVLLASISIVYFLIIVKWVIPSLGRQGSGYLHFRYAALGNTMSDAISTLFSRPFYSFKLLFVNQLGIPAADYLKTELHIAILLSGGILLFYRPYYLLMLLPIYGQKLFCDYYAYWGLSFHYSIEFLPILTIGYFTIINELEKRKTRRILVYTLILMTAAVTIRSFDNTYTYFDRQKQRFYQEPHYSRGFDVKEEYTSFNLIPEDAALSAQDEFVPHLCFREKIYMYPYIEDAKYIYINTAANIYPFATEKDFEASIDSLNKSKDWESIYNKNFTQIFRRK